MRYVEKYIGVLQAEDGNMIESMCFTFWITETTNTHSEYVILTAFSTATMVT